MATISIGKGSWLNLSSFLDKDGVAFWDTPNFPTFQPKNTDRYVNVTADYVNRLDLMAFDIYGDVDLWWVIALVNGIDLIPGDLVINQRLRIPSLADVRAAISRGPVAS